MRISGLSSFYAPVVTCDQSKVLELAQDLVEQYVAFPPHKKPNSERSVFELAG